MVTAITTWQKDNDIGMRVTINGEHVGEHTLEAVQTTAYIGYVDAFVLLFSRAKDYIDRWLENEREAARVAGLES